MDKRIHVPSDIKEYVKKKRKKRIRFCVFGVTFLLLVFACIEIFCYPIERISVWNRLGLYFIILLVFVDSIEIVAFLKDKSFCGTIIEVHDKVTRELSALTLRRTPNYIASIRIKILLPSGNKIWKTAYREKTDHIPHGIYTMGETVVHIKGTNYIQSQPKSKNDKVRCIICGHYNYESPDFCKECGHSLKIYRG